MRKVFSLFLPLFVLTSSSIQADDSSDRSSSETSPPIEEKSDNVPLARDYEPVAQGLYELRLSAFGGITTGATTTGTISGNNTSVSSTLNDNSTYDVGGEFTLQSRELWGVSLIGEYTSYKYANTSRMNDSHILFMVMPRVEIKIDKISLWAGFASGLSFTSIGNPSITENGATVTVNNPTLTGFTFSPRLGIDVFLMPRLYVGIFSSYAHLAGTLNETVNGTPFTQDFTRSWWTFSGRIGMQF